MTNFTLHSLYFNNPYSSSECGFYEIFFETADDALAVKEAVADSARKYLRDNDLTDKFSDLSTNDRFHLHEKDFWHKDESDHLIPGLEAHLQKVFGLKGPLVFEHSLILFCREKNYLRLVASDVLSWSK